MPMSRDVWRIFYTTRTTDVVSIPYAIDIMADDPSTIIAEHNKPLLIPGSVGTFDENGITVTCALELNGEVRLYYCGWNKRLSVPYALSIGVAIAEQNCLSFRKLYQGPILDRSACHPLGVSAPCVIYDEGVFRMWFITFTEWKEYQGRLEPTFVIAHSTSSNGIDWSSEHDVCISSSYSGESFARPWVIKDGNVFRMWYSKRGISNYRSPGGDHYRIQYAESLDGITWVSDPRPCLIQPSGTWDSEMNEYACVIPQGFNDIMFYNGNSFGRTGFGYATSQRTDVKFTAR